MIALVIDLAFSMLFIVIGFCHEAYHADIYFI